MNIYAAKGVTRSDDNGGGDVVLMIKSFLGSDISCYYSDDLTIGANKPVSRHQ